MLIPPFFHTLELMVKLLVETYGFIYGVFCKTGLGAVASLLEDIHLFNSS